MADKKSSKKSEDLEMDSSVKSVKKEKKGKISARVSSGFPIGLRLEASLGKVKKIVDNLVDLYSSTTDIKPQEAESIVSQRASNLMDKGQYGKAIDEFHRLIDLGKEDAAIYYNLGICCENEAMDVEAEGAYKKAIELDKDFSKAYYRLGTLAIGSDDGKTAIEYLKPIAMNGSFDVAYQLGVAYDKVKDHTLAIEQFQKAIVIDPKFAKTYKRLGYVYEAMGKHQEAVECFKKTMELEEI